MNREVFITCAVTGSGSTQDKSPHVPRSPKEIAKSAIAAAEAGEHRDLVHAVQEFGPEMAAHHAHHPVSHGLVR